MSDDFGAIGHSLQLYKFMYKARNKKKVLKPVNFIADWTK